MNIHTSFIGIIVYILAIIILAFVSIYKKWYILDKRNLFQQKLFWISIAVPLLSFIYFGVFAWFGKTPVLSAHGYARFYEISKFPLLILASSVPLASIVNNIHRTIQTEAQINSSEIKNAIDRHFAHEKNFVDKIKEISSFTMQSFVDDASKYYNYNDNNKIKILTTHEIKISNPYLLYSNIYTESSMDITSNYSPDENFKESILSILDTINNNLSKDKVTPHSNAEDHLTRLNTISYNIAKLLDTLCVDCISIAYIELKINGTKIRTFTLTESMLAGSLEAAFYLSKKILKLAYGFQLQNYSNIYNYLYIGEIKFDTEQFSKFLQPFYSPEWSAYVMEKPVTVNDGGTLAAEH